MNVPIDKTTIGQAEQVKIINLNNCLVHARVDTGARTSSIWVSSTAVNAGVLNVVFFGPESDSYTGKVYEFSEFTETVVASSSGHAEPRYKVQLSIVLSGRRVKASFTLADRSAQVYPMLIGRNVLRGKFIVDVKQGDRLLDQEKKRSEELKTLIDKERA